MKKILLVLVAGAVLIGIASSGRSGPTSGAPAVPRPGAAAVYAEIASDTNCANLQATFDHGVETSKRTGRVPSGPIFAGAQGARWSAVGLGYMEAADDRMRAVGCY